MPTKFFTFAAEIWLKICEDLLVLLEPVTFPHSQFRDPRQLIEIPDHSWNLHCTDSRSPKFTILPYAELNGILRI